RMRPGDLVEVRTPNAVAGIRGTVIVAEVFDARRSVITVLKGVIDVTRLDAGRASGPATVLNALQQVMITGANPVSTPQPISSAPGGGAGSGSGAAAAGGGGASGASASPPSAPASAPATAAAAPASSAPASSAPVASAPVAASPVASAPAPATSAPAASPPVI